MSAVVPPTPVPVDPAVPSEPQMPKPPTTKPRSRKAPKTAGISQVDKVKAFYKKRAKDPLHYQYTPEGNLRTESGETIPLRPFTALTPDELKAIEQAREEALDIAEADYEESLLKLREALDEYKTLGDEAAMNVVRLNKVVMDNSLFRTQVAYPSRWIHNVDNPVTSDILLNMVYEKRKLGYDAYMYKRQPFSMKDAWGHYRTEADVATTQAGGGTNTAPIFITDVKDKLTAHFHPTYEQEFVFDETRYVSPYQAYEAERFKELGNNVIRKQLLGTRSARTIHAIAEKEEQQPEHPEELWEAILLAFYSNHKDLATKLKDTGSAKFHVMDAEFGGQIYADALEQVRTRLREKENDDSVAEVGIANESVITEEEQTKARAGAIIHNMRRRH